MNQNVASRGVAEQTGKTGFACYLTWNFIGRFYAK